MIQIEPGTLPKSEDLANVSSIPIQSKPIWYLFISVVVTETHRLWRSSWICFPFWIMHQMIWHDFRKIDRSRYRNKMGQFDLQKIWKSCQTDCPWIAPSQTADPTIFPFSFLRRLVDPTVRWNQMPSDAKYQSRVPAGQVWWWQGSTKCRQFWIIGPFPFPSAISAGLLRIRTGSRKTTIFTFLPWVGDYLKHTTAALVLELIS